MDFTAQQRLLVFSKKEQKLKKHLEKVLANQDLTLQRQLIERVCQQLTIEPLDCAAALVLLSQSDLYDNTTAVDTEDVTQVIDNKENYSLLQPLPPPKMVCYRLEVGTHHQVTVDEIKNVFVNEAGVDIKMIGDVMLRVDYTLIELPEGMPADIYRLLASVSIHQQKLNIKRLKPRDRRYARTAQRRKK